MEYLPLAGTGFGTYSERVSRSVSAALFTGLLAASAIAADLGGGWKPLPPKSGDLYLLSGTEKFEARKNGSLLCYRFKRYVVTAKSRSEEFQVRLREGDDWDKACRWHASSAYWDMGRFQTGNFFGLSEPFLFLDLGTSHHRALYVFDLRTRQKVHQTTYWDPIELADGKILLWQGYGTATPENCPQFFDSGQGAIETQAVLDLETLKETLTGRMRCAFQE